jgi:hypothetical protein
MENRPVQSEDWLIHRIQIFKKFTFPSIVTQRNVDFNWLIYYYDDGFQREGFEKLIVEIKNYSNFYPIKVRDYEDFEKRLPQDVLKYSTGEHVITTRLDNDDAVSADFTDVIVDTLLPSTKEVLNFNSGYCYNYSSNYKNTVTRFFFRNDGPFLSLKEKRIEGIQTIMHQNHVFFHRSGQEIIQINKPIVMQIVHGRNSKNKLIGVPILNESQLVKDFPNLNEIKTSFYPKQILKFFINSIKHVFKKK